MMNRYLFKAKRKNNPKEWVYGSLLQEENRSFIGNYIHKILYGEKVCFSARNNKKETNKWNSFGLVEVIPETICQYTGLDDKNGNMIFENDIVRFTANRWNGVMEYPITYNAKQAKFVIDAKFKKFGIGNSNVEVIGNKFDEGDNNGIN